MDKRNEKFGITIDWINQKIHRWITVKKIFFEKMVIYWCWKVLGFIDLHANDDITLRPSFELIINFYFSNLMSGRPHTKIYFEISCSYRSVEVLNKRILAQFYR